MGLISAALLSASGTLGDQWKEYFYCEAIPNDTLAVKGKKKTTGLNKGSDNVISDGSGIAVADGQCMIIVDNGQVIDFCAEPGEYKYDSKTEPSLFTGSLGEGIKNVFAEIGKRITYGGIAAKDQRIYYINTKEITGVKYGTAAPVPFRVVDERAGIDIDVSVKCFGEYSIHICDPVSFYTNVCANVKDDYKLSTLEGQMKTELLTALQPAFSRISEAGIRYSFAVGHTAEIAEALNAELSQKWTKTRGIEIVSFGISSLKADEEDEKMLKKLQAQAAYANANLANAAMTAAAAQAMTDAANNSAGAGVGFMNLNMATGVANAFQTVTANAAAAQQQAAPVQQTAAPAADSWTCPSCGKTVTGNFCSSCGTAKPVRPEKWYCPQCGNANEGNFCSSCGTKKPE